MPLLERLSKTAAVLSVLLIVLLLLAMHPLMTPMLRIGGAAALAIGWVGAFRGTQAMQTIWVVVAFVAPTFLRLLSGREGEALDVVWMAGLAGALLRGTSWSRWALPGTWRILTAGWALTLSLAWPVLVAREIGFDLQGLTDLGAISSWAGRSAPEIIGWILFVVLLQLVGLLWLEWLRGVIAERPDRLPFAVHALWIGTTAASVVAVVQGTVDISLLSTPFWTSRHRATGTMLDANGYGMAAVIAGPIALLAVRAARPGAAAIAAGLFALNWVGLWMSGSRTAFFCAGAAAIGLAVDLWRSRHRTARGFTPLVAASIAGLIVITVAAGAIGPLRRLLEVPIDASSIRSLLWSRDGYGTIAVQMVREHPLTGVGVGAYHMLAPDYYRAMANDMLPWDNAQNWWRHQVAELGLLAGLLPIAWSMLVALRTFGVSRHSLPTGTFTVRALLVGIGVISLFGMPTQNPVVLLWTFFLVAWLIGSEPTDDAPPTQWVRIGWIAVTAIAIAYAAGHLVLARGALAVEERARRTSRDYVVGAYPAEALPGSNTFNWTDDESRFVWRARTPWLTMRVWAQHPDIEQNPVQVRMTTSCGVLFDEVLRSRSSVSLGLVLPDDVKQVDVTVSVSRTWQPSTFGAPDDRHLGVAVVADFVDSRERALSQMRTLKWPCGTSPSE